MGKSLTQRVLSHSGKDFFNAPWGLWRKAPKSTRKVRTWQSKLIYRSKVGPDFTLPANRRKMNVRMLAAKPEPGSQHHIQRQK